MQRQPNNWDDLIEKGICVLFAGVSLLKARMNYAEGQVQAFEFSFTSAASALLAAIMPDKVMRRSWFFSSVGTAVISDYLFEESPKS